MQSFEPLADLKLRTGFSGKNTYIFHRKGKDCRLIVAVCREGEEYLPLDPAPHERIEEFFISGDVAFADPNTFRLKGCSGVAVLISSAGASENV